LIAASALGTLLFVNDGSARADPPRETGPRLLVLTDIGGDPDDQQSMIRLMTYANEFDVEGLIASASGTPGELKETVTRPDLISAVVEAYGKVRPTLLLHRPDYPPAEALQDRIKTGNPQRGVKHGGGVRRGRGCRGPLPLEECLFGGEEVCGTGLEDAFAGQQPSAAPVRQDPLAGAQAEAVAVPVNLPVRGPGDHGHRRRAERRWHDAVPRPDDDELAEPCRVVPAQHIGIAGPATAPDRGQIQATPSARNGSRAPRCIPGRANWMPTSCRVATGMLHRALPGRPSSPARNTAGWSWRRCDRAGRFAGRCAKRSARPVVLRVALPRQARYNFPSVQGGPPPRRPGCGPEIEKAAR
jgi:hypothetical protein